MKPEPVLSAVLAIVEEVPPATAEAIARAVSAAGTSVNGRLIAEVVAQPDFRHAADGLAKAWAAAPDTSAIELAAMVRAAAAARKRALSDRRMDVVWTGPSTPGVPSRTTDAVVVELVEAARDDLLFVTYAAYPYTPLLDALRRAAARGVRTRVIIETIEGAQSFLGFEPASAFAGVPALESYWWPLNRRPVKDGSIRGRLHAKLAIADRDRALVTSANLTGSAIEDNLECGLLIRGGPLPGKLLDHLQALINQGTFERFVMADRHDQ